MKVLITGASRGIGFALSQYFASKGYSSYGVARDFTKNTYFWDQQSSLACDLSNSENWQQLYNYVETHGPFDVCIQNLGINHSGEMLHSKTESINSMVTVNLTLPVELTQKMIANKWLRAKGHFIFLNSLSHFVSYPGSSVYGATKDGLHSFTRSLSLTYKDKYKFLDVYPGPVDTDQARENSPLESKNSKRLSPTALSKSIHKAMISGQSTLIPQASNKLMAALSKLSPTLCERLMCEVILKKQRSKFYVTQNE